MTPWHALVAFLAGFGTACALMAYITWREQEERARRAPFLTQWQDGRHG